MSDLRIFLILRFEKLGWTWFYFLLSECLVHCQETSRICLQNIIFLHPFVDVILFRSACHGFCSQDCTSKWLKYKPHHKVSNINFLPNTQKCSYFQVSRNNFIFALGEVLLALEVFWCILTLSESFRLNKIHVLQYRHCYCRSILSQPRHSVTLGICQISTRDQNMECPVLLSILKATRSAYLRCPNYKAIKQISRSVYKTALKFV